MAVTAVTHIRHGKADGEVVEFGIGDNVKGLDDDELRSLVESGAAIETGSNRKFSDAPTATPEDAETLKRDELLAKANMANNEPTATTTEGGAEPPTGTEEGTTVKTEEGNQKGTGSTPPTPSGSGSTAPSGATGPTSTGTTPSGSGSGTGS